jgi:uncharacterized damage-inducible protein DinB
MPVLTAEDLLQYSEWERSKWRVWFEQHGAGPLKLSAGLHGDGRMQTVGEVVRHIFSGERRYLERLTDRPLSDPSSIPADNIDTLFEFGRQCRKDFREYIRTLPDQAWDVPREYSFMNMTMKLTPRKIIFQVLLHETRHWAQLATILRLQGLASEPQDFLFSPVLGGELSKEEGKRS